MVAVSSNKDAAVFVCCVDRFVVRVVVRFVVVVFAVVYNAEYDGLDAE